MIFSFAGCDNYNVEYNYIDDNNDGDGQEEYDDCERDDRSSGDSEQSIRSQSSCEEELQEQDVPVVTEDGHVVSRMLYNNECEAVLRGFDDDEEVCKN